MTKLTTALGLSALVTLASAHGFVTSPQARMPGPAMQKACGEQVAINQESDNYGNIQTELQVAATQTDYRAKACNIWQCKGYKFADNKDNVQSYSAGQRVPMTVDIRAPHTGVANVSIVDTASNSVVGGALKSWKVYGDNAAPIPRGQEHFHVTIPEDLDGKCQTAGECVIQWYWFAESIDQTYESCIDFTVADAGTGGASSSSEAATKTATKKPATKTKTPTTPTSTVEPVETTTAPTVAPTVTPTPTPKMPFITAEKPPKGTTMQDLLSWMLYKVEQLKNKGARRHARDLAF